MKRERERAVQARADAEEDKRLIEEVRQGAVRHQDRTIVHECVLLSLVAGRRRMSRSLHFDGTVH